MEMEMKGEREREGMRAEFGGTESMVWRVDWLDVYWWWCIVRGLFGLLWFEICSGKFSVPCWFGCKLGFKYMVNWLPCVFQ